VSNLVNLAHLETNHMTRFFKDVRFQVFHESELKAVRYPNPERPWVVIDGKYNHNGRRGRIVAHYRSRHKAKQRARNMNFLHNGGALKYPFINRFLVFVSTRNPDLCGIENMYADRESLQKALVSLDEGLRNIEGKPAALRCGHIFDSWQRKILARGEVIADNGINGWAVKIELVDENIYEKTETADTQEGWASLVEMDGALLVKK
jgi:hypothetical protein